MAAGESVVWDDEFGDKLRRAGIRCHLISGLFVSTRGNTLLRDAPLSAGSRRRQERNNSAKEQRGRVDFPCFPAK